MFLYYKDYIKSELVLPKLIFRDKFLLSRHGWPVIYSEDQPDLKIRCHLFCLLSA